DLADHQLAVARVQARIGRDLHVALDAAVVGHHVADAHFHREAADQPAHAALEDFHDHAFASPAAVHAGHAAQHAVAVHDLAHLERRQEQIVAHAAFRAQEAE